MCLITVKPRGVDLPKDEYLINGERTNKDGIGCAYWKVNTEEVVIKKDFKTIQEFIAWMKSNITIEDSLVIHFRIATSGLKDEGNRHPFPLTKDGNLLRTTNLSCESALAHNGVMSEYSTHEKYSDTQKFIMDIFGDEIIRNNIESPTIRKLINEYIGRDRLAILNNEGTIYVFGDYEKEDGLLFSNTSYRTWAQRYGGFANWRDREDYYGDNFTQQQKQLPNHYQKDTNNSGYMGTCDGCSSRTWIRYFETDKTTEHLFLCKKCRKLARKDKLNIPALRESFNSSVGDTLTQCNSCHKMCEDVTNWRGMDLCVECINGFSSYD